MRQHGRQEYEETGIVTTKSQNLWGDRFVSPGETAAIQIYGGDRFVSPGETAAIQIYPPHRFGRYRSRSHGVAVTTEELQIYGGGIHLGETTCYRMVCVTTDELRVHLSGRIPIVVCVLSSFHLFMFVASSC